MQGRRRLQCSIFSVKINQLAIARGFWEVHQAMSLKEDPQAIMGRLLLNRYNKHQLMFIQSNKHLIHRSTCINSAATKWGDAQAFWLLVQNQATLAISTLMATPVPPVAEPIHEDWPKELLQIHVICQSLGIPLVQLKDIQGASLSSRCKP